MEIITNRHGVIGGSTGSGKTTTVMSLVEDFVKRGLTVWVPDVKGDASALQAIIKGGKLPAPKLNEMGASVISKMLGLSEAQHETLVIIFKAEKKIYTWDELKMILRYLIAVPEVIPAAPTSSIRVILRKMEQFDDELIDELFNSTNTSSLLNMESCVLDCTNISNEPSLYAAYMIHWIDMLYKNLPEVGAEEKYVLFIDEAHLLFTDTPKRLIQLLERRIRLIRSRGVGVWFITQSASDLPAGISGQLLTFVQHSLNASTPAMIKAVKQTASIFDVPQDNIINLKPGEAYIKSGSHVELTKIKLPSFPTGAIPYPVEVTHRSIEAEEPQLTFWDKVRRNSK